MAVVTEGSELLDGERGECLLVLFSAVFPNCSRLHPGQRVVRRVHYTAARTGHSGPNSPGSGMKEKPDDSETTTGLSLCRSCRSGVW
jgi:hypothetical protein